LGLDDHKSGRESADTTPAPFTVSEYAARVAAVRATMRKRGLDALLVSSPENIFYLTGLSHQGHFAFTALVLKAEGECLLVARAMERHTLAAQVPDCEHVPFDDAEDPADAVARGGAPDPRRLPGGALPAARGLPEGVQP
jgi:Xaa-Pro dipeptidase